MADEFRFKMLQHELAAKDMVKELEDLGNWTEEKAFELKCLDQPNAAPTGTPRCANCYLYSFHLTNG